MLRLVQCDKNIGVAEGGRRGVSGATARESRSSKMGCKMNIIKKKYILWVKQVIS
jgi:hypothetical protein